MLGFTALIDDQLWGPKRSILASKLNAGRTANPQMYGATRIRGEVKFDPQRDGQPGSGILSRSVIRVARHDARSWVDTDNPVLNPLHARRVLRKNA